MPDLARIDRLLEDSEAPGNPPASELRAILSATRTVAVIGLSRDPLKAARRVPSYLATKGIDLVPVNPHAEWLLGKPVVSRLEEVKEPVDLVLIFRPSEEAAPFVRSAAARPEAPVIWLQEGITAVEAAEEARAAGRTVIQDLCIFKVHRSLFENRPGPMPSRT